MSTGKRDTHDAAGECKLHDDKIKMEIYKTKFLCVKEGTKRNVIAEKEGGGEVRGYSQ